ncbi:hypothetical protein ACFTXO_31145, partial [Streptomyces sp. NPDC057067]
MAAGFMTVTTGCGLISDSGSAPAASPETTPPFTTETVADEIAGFARAAGLPPGDTSTAALPQGDWHTCVAPWTGYAPAAVGAGGGVGSGLRQRGHGWEIGSSHAVRVGA